MISGIIFYLLRRGAHREPLYITTGELAAELGVSQQTVSRRLILLEKEGRVERRGGAISVTPTAVSEAKALLRELLSTLDESSLVFMGGAVAGLGQGAYYLSQKCYKEHFRKKLGFIPFPGTLNVSIPADQIEKRMMLREKPPIKIPGFCKGGKSFGEISAYRCVVGGIPSAVIFPERSAHGLQVLEVVAPFSLRQKLKLQDGSQVSVEVLQK